MPSACFLSSIANVGMCRMELASNQKVHKVSRYFFSRAWIQGESWKHEKKSFTTSQPRAFPIVLAWSFVFLGAWALVAFLLLSDSLTRFPSPLLHIVFIISLALRNIDWICWMFHVLGRFMWAKRGFSPGEYQLPGSRLLIWVLMDRWPCSWAHLIQIQAIHSISIIFSPDAISGDTAGFLAFSISRSRMK